VAAAMWKTERVARGAAEAESGAAADAGTAWVTASAAAASAQEQAQQAAQTTADRAKRLAASLAVHAAVIGRSPVTAAEEATRLSEEYLSRAERLAGGGKAIVASTEADARANLTVHPRDESTSAEEDESLKLKKRNAARKAKHERETVSDLVDACVTAADAAAAVRVENTVVAAEFFGEFGLSEAAAEALGDMAADTAAAAAADAGGYALNGSSSAKKGRGGMGGFGWSSGALAGPGPGGGRRGAGGGGGGGLTGKSKSELEPIYERRRRAAKHAMDRASKSTEETVNALESARKDANGRALVARESTVETSTDDIDKGHLASVGDMALGGGGGGGGGADGGGGGGGAGQGVGRQAAARARGGRAQGDPGGGPRRKPRRRRR
jgi:hypothetical protein